MIEADDKEDNLGGHYDTPVKITHDQQGEVSGRCIAMLDRGGTRSKLTDAQAGGSFGFGERHGGLACFHEWF